MEPKRLYRSHRNRMLAGVCAGIADYFKVDPTLIRLIAVVTGCLGGGLLAYVIATIIIPNEP